MEIERTADAVAEAFNGMAGDAPVSARSDGERVWARAENGRRVMISRIEIEVCQDLGALIAARLASLDNRGMEAA